MFTTYITVALSAAAAVSASVLPRTATAAAKYPVPSTYAHLWLENYDVYHTRYLALDCEDKHNTQFFDDCCHPMLKWETLATARKPYCVPGAVSSQSSGIVSSTAVATKTATPTSAALIASPTPSSTAGEECTEDSDDCECVDDDGEGEECEEGEEDCVCEDEEPTSSAASHSTTFAHSSSASRSTVLVTSTVTASTATSAAVSASSAVSSSAAASSSAIKSTATSTVESATSSKEAASSTQESSSAKPTSTETPTSTVQATSTTVKTSSAAAATSSVPLDKQTTGTLTGGFATFFWQGGVAGACGKAHADSALIAAIDGRRYGNLGAVSTLCGVQAQVTNEKNGKSVLVSIVDACPTCTNENSIDLSHGAFTAIATEEEGEVPVTIKLLGKN